VFQYLALGVVAALILAGLVAAGMPARLASGAGTVVCEVVQTAHCAHPPAAARDPHAVPAPRTPGKDAGHGHKKPTGNCHGLFGCAVHYASGGLHGLVKGAKHTRAGVAALFTAGASAWTFGTWLDRTFGAGGFGCAVTGPLCPGGFGDKIKFGDQIRKAVRDRDPAALGRALRDLGRTYLPSGIPGLDPGEALQKAHDLLDTARTRRDDQGGGHLTAGESWRLLDEYRRLGPEERSAFLSALTPAERLDLFRWAEMDVNLKPDILRHLLPKQVRQMYGAADAGLRADVVAYAPPDVLRRLHVKNPTFRRGGGWRRFKGPVFDGAPKAADVYQGRVGDCWCLAPMEAVAQQSPGTIEKMITTNPNGTYSVTFGDGRRVTVTPDLPRNGARTDGAGWPAILEKAFAERYGGYDKIWGGQPSDALRELTGRRDRAPLYERWKPDIRVIGDRFAKGDAFTVGVEEGAHDLPRGLVAKHVYAVLDVDAANGTVLLGNPWGPHARQVTLTADELADPHIILDGSATK
jgi:hypothetical protein